jgi:hypothetical protein
MQIHWTLSIGYPQANRTGVVELPDDATEKEIEKAVHDEADQYLDLSWSAA